MANDSKYVPVIEAYDLVEHAEIRSLLETEEIRVFQPPSDTTGLMGSTENLEILVHIDDEEDAVRLLEKHGFFTDEAEAAEAEPVSEEEEEKKKRSRAQDLVLAALLFVILAWALVKFDPF
ncbi:MAG: hypothetical protein J0L75_07600 [Spirochaetes bacterium]|nr:hypothetical protein [Spirochaetota bacterium]